MTHTPLPADRPLRILLMGDASNYHNCLATGLRRMGHEVTVASHGSRWMDTARDIDLTRRPGRINGLLYWLGLWQRRRLFTGYDIVQLVGSGFIEQRPGRIMQFYDYLRRNNSRVFITALGTEPYFVDTCLDVSSPLQYSEWRIHDKPGPYALAEPEVLAQWQSEQLRALCGHIYGSVDGVATALYEYDVAVRRHYPDAAVHYTGIPVDTATIEPVIMPEHIDCVRLFVGAHAHRMAEKGTDRMLAAARRVEARHPGRCIVDVVSDLPYEQYLWRMRTGHLIIDQLYSYTPATNALLAMAMGLPTLSGGEEAYYNFIGERRLRPVINAIPDDEALERTIEHMVLNPGELRRRSAEGREFVKRHNDVSVVASRFIDLWSNPASMC